MPASPAVSAPVSPHKFVAHPGWGKRLLLTLGVVLFLLVVNFILHLVLPRTFAATGVQLPLDLPSGKFYTLYYNKAPEPKGIVILGTGDGGWSYWEENTAQHLIAQGYAVGGWDCRKFANSRTYTQEDLAAGFAAAVEAVRERSEAEDDVPVWYGGWSTGAEQSVAAAAWAQRPKQLVGLLLAAPGRTGRYGITAADLLGKEPSGPDTFRLTDLAPAMQGLRIVQFSAGLDFLDDASWGDALKVPYKLVKIPGVLHDMGGAGPRFQGELDQAMAWTLQPNT